MEGEATWKIDTGIPGTLVYTADHHVSLVVTSDDGSGKHTQVFPCKPGDQV
jgi:hypothetical protein